MSARGAPAIPESSLKSSLIGRHLAKENPFYGGGSERGREPASARIRDDGKRPRGMPSETVPRFALNFGSATISITTRGGCHGRFLGRYGRFLGHPLWWMPSRFRCRWRG